jgi:uncharacterized protein
MNNYVLDTNFFFNLEIKSGFGDNPREIIESITDYARRAKKSGKAAFYMPPKIIDELYTFVDKDEEYIRNFLAEISIKAPDRSSMQFSSDVFYALVDDIRKRSYRGLQVAEEELTNAVEAFVGKEKPEKIGYQKQIGEHIKKLRDRYRNATRVKFLDSIADLDIIVLSKELDGYVVSSDEGVIQWARKFGVKEAVPQVLKTQLDSLLQA